MAINTNSFRRISLIVAIPFAGLVLCLFIFQDNLSYWYAQKRNTLAAFQAYIDSNPNGKHAFEADWMIQSIQHPATFAIGILKGSSPFDYSTGAAQPVLGPKDVTDTHASMVADPFMIRRHDTWYMFFEVENEASRQGDIGYATSRDGLDWTYGKIVLNEPFHLSYPYVFEHGGDYYMIPESNAASSVRLYKASDFPEKWEFTTTLLTGERFSDNSILQYNGKWWLFSETSSRPHDNGTLRLYLADHLTGPWREHPQSPLIEGNPNIARPGGRIVSYKNDIFRFTQDCYPVYGYQVWAFKITELTPHDYAEVLHRKTPVIKASGKGWNRLRMHHIDPHKIEGSGWMASVDGFGDIQ